MRRIVLAATLLVMLTAAGTAEAAPGDNDVAFGSGAGYAIATGDPGSTNAGAMATAVQDDGKIVLVGKASPGVGTDMLVWRLMPNGDPDTSFSGDGRITVNAGPYEVAHGVAIQDNNKIVVVGRSTAQGADHEDAIVFQLLPNGTLDPTFGTAGIARRPFSTDDSAAQSVFLQPNGRILISGYAQGPSSAMCLVARLNTDGSLDTSFGGGDAKWEYDNGGESCVLRDLALQPDASMVAVGWRYDGTDTGPIAVRLTSAGVPDTSFSGDGLVFDSLEATEEERFSDVLIEPNGRIVAVAAFEVGGDLHVVRYRTDGSRDLSFAGDGDAELTVEDTYHALDGVVRQDDGKLVIAGSIGVSNNGTTRSAFLMRLQTSGAIDSTFGIDGMARTAPGSVSWLDGFTQACDGDLLPFGTDSGSAWIGRFDSANTAGSCLNTPTGLETTPQRKSISLNWNPDARGFGRMKYEVAWRRSSGSWHTLPASRSLSARVTGLKTNTRYQVRLRAGSAAAGYSAPVYKWVRTKRGGAA